MSRDPKLILANKRLHAELVALRTRPAAADALAVVAEKAENDLMWALKEDCVLSSDTIAAMMRATLRELEAALRQYKETT